MAGIVENVDLVRAAQPGRDLTLSIDRRIQYLAHRELRNAIDQIGASSGSAVVLDVATGEVLAMVNLPTFNPNAVGGSPRDAHRNRAVTDLFEPGSTMKPLTVAAALEAGVITPGRAVRHQSGLDRRMAGSAPPTPHNYGVLDTTGVITQELERRRGSKIARRWSNDQFYDFIRRFGYGDKTAQRLPRRIRRRVPARRSAGTAPASRRCPTAMRCR